MNQIAISPIRTEHDYQEAIKHLDKLLDMNPEPGTELDDELEVLTTLVHAYEKVHYPIELPDPIDAIKQIIEEKGWSNKDLEPFIGPKSRVSEILNRKRYFTIPQIYRLHKHLGLPLEVFINESVLKAA
ncbi:helix-turn-helix domain-containing protein [Adhaeribacter swui]|uniref:Helix-turn-helix domain-containing protein n=1 Tax=Adhaeribacter swui TaxID=2086471 RepID=A0A7G7GDM7_9BACT|nr:helix-turn-helix domain-containing protein [Adhaeribacter swui]QNF35261.1 helix-turn-helix domain-containing protein [Adhaeribacter swui]